MFPPKSRKRHSLFPVSGESRNPRPAHCNSRPGLAVGRSITTQSMLGTSIPVVMTETLAQYFSGGIGVPNRSAETFSPRSRAMMSARSFAGVSPVTTAHSFPVYCRIFSATFLQWSTDVQKISTVFLATVKLAISRQAASVTSSLFIAVSTSSEMNSPPRMCKPSKFASVLPALETIGDKYP